MFMYDVDDGVTEPRYLHARLPLPEDRRAPRPMRFRSGAFRKEFLERLAVELAQYHIDHKTSSGIAEGR